MHQRGSADIAHPSLNRVADPGAGTGVRWCEADAAIDDANHDRPVLLGSREPGVRDASMQPYVVERLPDRRCGSPYHGRVELDAGSARIACTRSPAPVASCAAVASATGRLSGLIGPFKTSRRYAASRAARSRTSSAPGLSTSLLIAVSVASAVSCSTRRCSKASAAVRNSRRPSAAASAVRAMSRRRRGLRPPRGSSGSVHATAPMVAAVMSTAIAAARSATTSSRRNHAPRQPSHSSTQLQAATAAYATAIDAAMRIRRRA